MGEQIGIPERNRTVLRFDEHSKKPRIGFQYDALFDFDLPATPEFSTAHLCPLWSVTHSLIFTRFEGMVLTPEN